MLNNVKDFVISKKEAFKIGYNPFLAAIEITHAIIICTIAVIIIAISVVIAIMKTLVEITYKVINNGEYIMYKNIKETRRI